MYCALKLSYGGWAGFDIRSGRSRHWLWSWKTQPHSCLGNWLQETDCSRTRARRPCTVGLPSKPSGHPPHGRANRVNAGDCIIPLVGEASLWTSAVIARNLLMAASSGLLWRASQQLGSQGILQHRCISSICWRENTLFPSSRTLIFLYRISNRNPIYEKDKQASI